MTVKELMEALAELPSDLHVSTYRGPDDIHEAIRLVEARVWFDGTPFVVLYSSQADADQDKLISN